MSRSGWPLASVKQILEEKNPLKYHNLGCKKNIVKNCEYATTLYATLAEAEVNEEEIFTTLPVHRLHFEGKNAANKNNLAIYL